MVKYRDDIDGLRAMAVLAVILFHLGLLPAGYLGVDVFFVISGYLITGIVYREVSENNFSVFRFYERRIRRIMPLLLFVSLTAFVAGLFLMLPDDLENLSQAVVATNFSANNILMYITSSDYWSVRNEYKPLMHTWSLGVEEQYYLLYPLLFLFLQKKGKQLILPVLGILTLASLAAFLLVDNDAAAFYFLHYRFFELAAGGIGAIYFQRSYSSVKDASPLQASSVKRIMLPLSALLLLLLLIVDFSWSNEIKVLLVTVLTTGILLAGEKLAVNNSIYKVVFSNFLITRIGKISFSLYMWHQLVLAFARYSLVETITPVIAVLLVTLTFVLSVFSYKWIETPFRNRARIKTQTAMVVLGISVVISSISALYVYGAGGVIRSVPELDIEFKGAPRLVNQFNSHNNIHIRYNEEVRQLDKPFQADDENTVKILVIGDSYARDMVNVLNEFKKLGNKSASGESFFSSSLKDDQDEIADSELINSSVVILPDLQLRYAAVGEPSRVPPVDLQQRMNEADIILYAYGYKPLDFYRKLQQEYRLDEAKIWKVGIKDFGASNGIHYHRKEIDFNTYRTAMKKGVWEENQYLKAYWDGRYIDLITPVADKKGNVRIFTSRGKFISQDTVHFTPAGAAFYAHLLETRLRKLIQKVNK